MMIVRYPCLFCGAAVPPGTSHSCGSSQSANTPEPAPLPGVARSTWDLVIEDMAERDRLGAGKVRRSAPARQRPRHLVDAYQECLDQALYLRAEIEKRKGGPR